MTLRWVPGYRPLDDPDAENYILAVQAADEAASPGIGELEDEVKAAIHAFIKGCKNDGIWNAIKASCILAGARTLNGALVPLVGTAPTNFNFVSGDYNRKTGLVGDGSTKYLDSNRGSTAEPANNFHLSAYQSTAQTTGSLIQDVGGATAGSSYLLFENTNYRFRGSGNFTRAAVTAGFVGGSLSGTALTHRANLSNASQTVASPAAASGNMFIFARQGPAGFSNARLAFYSIGESLDLALLDARVTTLINQFGAVIP